MAAQRIINRINTHSFISLPLHLFILTLDFYSVFCCHDTAPPPPTPSKRTNTEPKTHVHIISKIPHVVHKVHIWMRQESPAGFIPPSVKWQSCTVRQSVPVKKCCGAERDGGTVCSMTKPWSHLKSGVIERRLYFPPVVSSSRQKEQQIKVLIRVQAAPPNAPPPPLPHMHTITTHTQKKHEDSNRELGGVTGHMHESARVLKPWVTALELFGLWGGGASCFPITILLISSLWH